MAARPDSSAGNLTGIGGVHNKQFSADERRRKTSHTEAVAAVCPACQFVFVVEYQPKQLTFKHSGSIMRFVILYPFRINKLWISDKLEVTQWLLVTESCGI